MRCKITKKDYAERYMIKHEGRYIPYALYTFAAKEVKKSVISIDDIKAAYEKLIKYENLLIDLGRLLRKRAKSKMLPYNSECNYEAQGELNQLTREEVEGFRKSLRYWALTEKNKDLSVLSRDEMIEYITLLLQSDKKDDTKKETTEAVRKYIRDWIEKGINSVENRTLVYEIM